MSHRIAPFAFDVLSPFPGAVCLCGLHLPELPPILVVSIYARNTRRQELERSPNQLFTKYKYWILGGDLNALVTHLDTNGTTVNRWQWFTSVIEEKKGAADTFRSLHHNRIAYTRYHSPLLPCDTHIDLILMSSHLQSLFSLWLNEATIDETDSSSNHHPISYALRPPCTPHFARPPAPSTLVRRLTKEENAEFQNMVCSLTA